MSETGIFVQIHKEIVAGTVQLPALPDIALRIGKALKDPRIDLAGIARIIQVDAGLTAYLIQIANSPLYRGSRTVDSLSVALSRLGLTATRNLAMSYALMALYSSGEPALRPQLKKLWQHSTRLGALACVLARHCQGMDADRAMLGALIQDIGALPLLQKAAQYRELISDDEQIRHLLDRYAVNVGCSLLKKWGFEEDMLDIVRSREDWKRDPAPVADYADIILIARLHSYAGTERMRELPKLNEVPAFRKLPMGEISLSFSLKLLDEARQQVLEVQRAISGAS